MSSIHPSRDKFQIGWICALSLEMEAAKAVLDDSFGTLEEQEPADPNSYFLGRIEKHYIVITCLPQGQYGEVSAAAIATNMVRTFSSMRVGLMVGIGGGVPSSNHDIRLGDIVISRPDGSCGGVIQYDTGKIEEGGQFRRTGCLNSPPRLLLTAASNMESSGPHGEEAIKRTAGSCKGFARPSLRSDRLFKTQYEHPASMKTCDGCLQEWEVMRNERAEDRPRTHYGIIATGNCVMKHGASRDKIHQETGALCFEMEAAGLMQDFPCIVIRGISDYADSHKSKQWQRYAALTAASYAKELLKHVPLAQVAQQELMADIPYIAAKLDDLKRSGDTIKQMLDLGRLKVASGAAFDSIDNEHAECLRGTRVVLLRNIKEWARSSDGKCIFWLNGMAGTGKSVIAKTIASRLQKSLGASFFFRRGERDRGNARKLFPTLISQLVLTIPPLLPEVQKIIEDDPGITEKVLTVQFEKLLLEPLSKVSKYRDNVMVIVIDALDECDDEEQISLILQLLPRVQTIGSIKLRFLLTSRPVLPMARGIRNIFDSHQSFVLHRVSDQVIEDDLSVYFRKQFSDIRLEHHISSEWPGNGTIDLLVKRAAPLFISAATMCRFIGEKRWNPRKRLECILQDDTAYLYKVASIYTPILNHLIFEQDAKEAKDLIQDFKEIIGVIIFLKAPLSIRALGQFLNRTIDDIICRLNFFHSVLDVSSENLDIPVRLFHQSFRDFLLVPDPMQASPFLIDEKEANKLITTLCVRTMGSLRKNVLNIPQESVHRQELSEDIIDRHIPLELQYSCRYWTDHLEKSEDPVSLADKTLELLDKHFLHWVEVMSILGCASEIGRMVDLFQSLTENQSLGSLQDAKRFFLKNRQIMELNPLQIYCSGLIFAPKTTNIRAKFEKDLPDWISILPSVEETQSMELQTLVGHSARVQVVKFSSDGRLLASGSDDKTIRLWDPINGVHLNTLKGHLGAVLSIAFSHHNRMLASGSADCTVRIWDLTTGTIRNTLVGHVGSVLSVAFSHDSRILASGSTDARINLWDPTRGTLEQSLGYHIGPVRSVAFSPYDSLLISGSDDERIQLWNTSTRKLRTLGYLLGSIQSLDISSDGCLMVSSSRYPIARSFTPEIRFWNLLHIRQKSWISYAGGLHKWDNVRQGPRFLAFFLNEPRQVAHTWNKGSIQIDNLTTLEKEATLEGHLDSVCSVGFSPDGQLLASGSDDNTVRLWNPRGSLQPQRTPVSYSSPILCMKFSSDGQVMVSGSENGTIRLWDPVSGDVKKFIRAHASQVHSVTFSQDDRLLASGSNGMIKVWDITTAAEKMTVREPVSDFGKVNLLAFSSDSRILASATGHEIRLWSLDRDMTRGIFDYFSSIRPLSLLHILRGHSGEILCMAFSPDNGLIVSGSSDRTIRLWNSGTGVVYRILRGHSGPVCSVAISSDGRLLVSGSFDQTIRLWDPAADTLPQTLVGRGVARTLEFSEDETYLITNVGNINICPSDGISMSASPGARKELFLQDDWVWIGGKKTIWLPLSMWSAMSACKGNILALGYHSGHVSFIGIRF